VLYLGKWASAKDVTSLVESDSSLSESSREVRYSYVLDMNVLCLIIPKEKAKELLEGWKSE